jgi:hypothetical protein
VPFIWLSNLIPSNKKALRFDYEAGPFELIHPPQAKVRRKNNWKIKRIAWKYHKFSRLSISGTDRCRSNLTNRTLLQ